MATKSIKLKSTLVKTSPWSPLHDVMQLRVSVLPHARLSAAWAGESMYFCHANIGWSGASAVCLKCYLWQNQNHWWLSWCVSCEVVISGWGCIICVTSSTGCDAVAGCVSLVTMVWCLQCPGHVTWRTACHHAMIATVCTNHNQDLGLRGMHSVSRHIYKLQSRQ